METLEGLMKAYEARLKTNETIEQGWRRYPKLVNVKRQLELYRCLVEATQALLECISATTSGKREHQSKDTQHSGGRTK